MLGRVAIWVLVAVVLFTVFKQFDNRTDVAVDTTSYTQFMDDAKAGKIKRVDIQGRKIFVKPNSGSEYQITSPGDLWMVDDLRKDGVAVYGKAEEEPSDASPDWCVDFLHAPDAGRRQGRCLLVWEEQGPYAGRCEQSGPLL